MTVSALYCPDDCPAMFDCEPACVAAMQCQALLSILILPDYRLTDLLAQGARVLVFASANLPTNWPQDGLQRPPKI